MKNVLLISYHFPPDSRIGAVRPAEFAKSLPLYNWSPIILSVKEKYYSEKDYDRYAPLLNKNINRTLVIPNINNLYLYLKDKFVSEKAIEQKSEYRSLNPGISENTRGITYILRRYYNSLLVYLPDNYSGWFMPAVLKGFQLINKNKIDAIITTGPPHSVHLIGLIFKLIFKIQWISDFRDPWEEELKPKRSRTFIAEKIEGTMIKNVIKHSNWVVSVTPEMTQRLQEKYPKMKKFQTIMNGFDSKAFTKYKETNKFKIFTITYVGSLYFGRNPFFFLKAISELKKEGHVSENNLNIKLIGDCKYSDGISVEEMVDELKLNDIVTFIDPIPHHDAITFLSKSQVLLLFANDQPLQIPAKVYEYIALKSKIIALCGNGATTNLLQNYPLAYCSSPEDMITIKKIVSVFLKNKENKNEKKLSSFDFSKFERRELTNKMVNLLETNIQ